MKHTPIVIIALLVGFGIGLAVGHTYLVKPNETTMLVVSGDKTIPHVSAGETLKWVGPNPNKPVTGFVIGLGGGLCNEEDKNTHTFSGDTCTVKGVGSKGLSYARYDCTGCGDPDVAAGSDVRVPILGGVIGAASSSTTSRPIVVWCNGPGTPALADPVSALVVLGQTIHWAPSVSVTGKWSVDGLSAACGSGNDSYTTGALCTVQSASSPYTYNVTVGQCKGTASLTISVK